MDLGDYEIVTPIEDPYQYSPEWRSVLANYLVDTCKIRTHQLKSISEFGGVVEYVSDGGDGGEKKKGRTKKAKSGRPKGKKSDGDERSTSIDVKDDGSISVIRGIFPFNVHPEYRILAADIWIEKRVRFINESIDKKTTQESIPVRIAQRWFEEKEGEAIMRKKLEAFLLTEASIDTIATDLLGDARYKAPIEIYEKLYFNCRDDNFITSKSEQLINRMAMPYGPLKAYLKKWETLDRDGICKQDGRPIAKDSDVWKSIAANFGYDALVAALGMWTKASGLKDRTMKHFFEEAWIVYTSRIISDLFTGSIAHEDAARILSSFTSQTKQIVDEKILDRKNGGGEENEILKAFLGVLNKTAPKLVSIDGELLEKKNKEIQDRIDSQLAISNKKIDDMGERVNYEVVNEQISNAISGGLR